MSILLWGQAVDLCKHHFKARTEKHEAVRLLQRVDKGLLATEMDDKIAPCEFLDLAEFGKRTKAESEEIILRCVQRLRREAVRLMKAGEGVDVYSEAAVLAVADGLKGTPGDFAMARVFGTYRVQNAIELLERDLAGDKRAHALLEKTLSDRSALQH